MKKLKLWGNKFLYGIYTASPIPWGMFFASVYFALPLKDNFWLFSHHWLVSYGFFPLLVFLSPWLFVLWRRWLPSSLIIPTLAKEENRLNGKVRFSTSSIFDQPGDLILSYNRNNIAGGILMMNSFGGGTPNLMAQFMHRYFGRNQDGQEDREKPDAKKEDLVYFDWDLFVSCYQSSETKVYCPSEEGGIREIDKNSVPLKSSYREHFRERPELDPARYDPNDGALFPEGTVIALKLPEQADGKDKTRRYAFLLCNTLYYPEKSRRSISSLEMLEKCLSSVWRVIDKTPETNAQYVCMPFLGKGYSGLKAHSYGILWSIVFSYRQAIPEGTEPDYGINICIPPKELLSRRIWLREAARFLEYALLG